jgi:hypothetical protein
MMMSKTEIVTTEVVEAGKFANIANLSESKYANDAYFKTANAADLKLGALAKEWSIDLTQPIEDRWISAKGHAERHQMHYAAKGLLLLSIKEEVPHGEFESELERRGFEPRRAREAMRYAMYVFSKPVEMQNKLLGMPVTKVCTLAAADPKVVSVLMEEGEERITSASVRELKAEIKRLEGREGSFENSIGRLQAELANTKAMLRVVSPFTQRTEVVRMNCRELQKELELPLHELEQLFNEVAREPLLAEYNYQIESVWLAAVEHLAHASSLVHRMQKSEAAQSFPDSVQPHHALTEEEAGRWMAQCAMITAAYSIRRATAKTSKATAK